MATEITVDVDDQPGHITVDTDTMNDTIILTVCKHGKERRTILQAELNQEQVSALGTALWDAQKITP